MEVKVKYKRKIKLINKKTKNRKKEIILITIFLIMQTIIYVICGANKSYIHMDEAYSLGLASYEKVEIQDNEDFYNTWHSNEYYEDYLSVQEDEKGQYSQVYENQKNDVHPPLYYLILRFAMGFAEGHFSKWSGITINIVIYMFITIFTYLILKKIFMGQNKAQEKSIILAFMSSITMASLTNAIYIRMYALSTLNILITTYLHIKLLEDKENNWKLLTLIGTSALIGSLTHYYYLFYLAIVFIIYAIKYIKEKNWKKLEYYIITMVIAGVLSLLIFPYSIQHMFFGYRGQGVISNLTNIQQFLNNVETYIRKVNYYGFNNMLYLLIIFIIGSLLYRIKNKIRNFQIMGKVKSKEFLRIMYLPTIFYFLIVSVASPFTELRYIMPICSLIFILIVYYLYKLLTDILSEKITNKILIILFIVMLVTPLIFKIEPEALYSDKKEIVQKLESELNVPTLYLFNTQNNRFLDDILLFAKIDESYIAKDIEKSVNIDKRIKEIVKKKDITKGLVIFINEGQNNDALLDIIKNVTNLNNCKHIERLNACDVYYLI